MGVTLHVFCSAKGGVGKTSLAVEAASMFARDPNRRCVLIDSDFTGTSIADDLDLCAPKTRTRLDGTLEMLKHCDQTSVKAGEAVIVTTPTPGGYLAELGAGSTR